MDGIKKESGDLVGGTARISGLISYIGPPAYTQLKRVIRHSQPGTWYNVNRRCLWAWTSALLLCDLVERVPYTSPCVTVPLVDLLPSPIKNSLLQTKELVLLLRVANATAVYNRSTKYVLFLFRNFFCSQAPNGWIRGITYSSLMYGSVNRRPSPRNSGSRTQHV